jgi:hypothetical protein
MSRPRPGDKLTAFWCPNSTLPHERAPFAVIEPLLDHMNTYHVCQPAPREALERWQCMVCPHCGPTHTVRSAALHRCPGTHSDGGMYDATAHAPSGGHQQQLPQAPPPRARLRLHGRRLRLRPHPLPQLRPERRPQPPPRSRRRQRPQQTPRPRPWLQSQHPLRLRLRRRPHQLVHLQIPRTRPRHWLHRQICRARPRLP